MYIYTQPSNEIPTSSFYLPTLCSKLPIAGRRKKTEKKPKASSFFFYSFSQFPKETNSCRCFTDPSPQRTPRPSTQINE